MKNLLDSEIYKLYKNKIFYICIGVTVITTFVAALIMEFSRSNMNEDMLENSGMAKESIEGFYSQFSGINYGIGFFSCGDILCIIAAICITIFVCNEFSYGTIKNIASKGYKRSEIYLSKIIGSVIISLIICITGIIFSFIWGTIFWGAGSINEKGSFVIFTSIFLGILLFITMGIINATVCFIVRNGGIASGINICIILLISNGIKLMDLLFSGNITPGKFWIGSMIQELSNMALTRSDALRMLVCIVVYIGICVFIGIRTFSKCEVK